MKTITMLMMLLGFVTVAQAQPTQIDFSPNRNIVSCGPTTVYFVYNRAVTPDLISWDFGDGTFSSELAPAHAYTTPGNYTVKLIIIKKNQRDSVVKNNFVCIKPKPEAHITLARPANYAPLKIQLLSNSQHHADSFKLVRWITAGDTIENPTASYTFPTEGQYRISLEVMNSCGCADVKDTTIYMSADGFEPVTGLTEKLTSSMLVYPNPATNTSTLVLPDKLNGPVQVTLCDYNGKQVSPYYTRYGNNLLLQLEIIPNGIYFLTLESQGQQWKSKLIIQH